MKNTTPTQTISSLLGLTQQQMALLLQVSRGQWSMYESGKRRLPLRAVQLLAEMVGFLKFEDKGMLVERFLIEQQQANKIQLEKLLRENEDQLYLVRKKIAPVEKQYSASLSVIGLTDYLTTHSAAKSTLDAELLEVLSSQAKRNLQKSGLATLTTLRMMEERLELEKILLSAELRKTVASLRELTD